MTEHRPDRREVAETFGRAALTYDDCATVQREVCQHLAVLAAGYPLQGPAGAILDAGCGTGSALGLLAERYPQHLLLALDLAAPMLARCAPIDAGQRCLRGDIAALPLAGDSLAAVWSSLSLQWCDPRRALGEIGRCLRPGGLAWVATLGPETFVELRYAFAQVDHSEHVLECHPPALWSDAARLGGLELLAVERRRFTARAPDLRGLLRDIKAIGAQGIGPGRRRALLGKDAWRTVVDRYERFRDAKGMVGATYDAIFLMLRKRP